MFENLIKADQSLFLAINGWHSPFWDQVMWLVSNKLFWIPLYLFVLAWLIKIYKRRFWALLVFIILLVTLTDQTSVHLFKDVFKRLRPCHNEMLAPMVHLVKDHCGGLYGFISSHATNYFGIATFSALLIRNRTYTILVYLWVAWIGYSRVYLGVHFPGDVLAGAFTGTLLGWMVYVLFRETDRKWLHRNAWFNPEGTNRQRSA